MPRYIVFNSVNSDGVGDFTHFEDIMKALLADPKYRDVEFIPIVCFSGKESNYIRIGEKMRALGIPFYYGKQDDHARFSSDETLHRLLNEADQALIISYDSIGKLYQPFLKEGIPIKHIGEHEGLSASGISKYEGVKQRSLGLSTTCYGIKIQDIPTIPPHEAWCTINESDPEFATQLLAQTASPNFAVFRDNNIVIPAYFNNTQHFVSFLYLFSINHSLHKNIIIYHSGGNLLATLKRFGKENFAALFGESDIARIEVITPDNHPMVLDGNPLGSQTMRIFTGFYVSDRTFNSIYQLSSLAGVSGDNTLERCVSMNLLPFYWSTNEENKRATLRALQEITQLPELLISREARDSFNIFFDRKECLAHIKTSFSWFEDLPKITMPMNKFALLDLPKMIEAWPAVTAYLRQNKNFYQNMESIILESLPLEAQPAFYAEESRLRQAQIKETMLKLKSDPDPESFTQKL